jgi:probable rRNA maturation factor
MIKINVIISNVKWFYIIKNPNSYVDRKVKKLNLKTKMLKKRKFFCTLLLSGNKEIIRLNKKFRKKNKPTDVLSFPFHNKNNLKKKIKNEKEIYLGDIIINFNKISNTKNPKEFKIQFNKLWIHGLIHLFGYDHKEERDFKKMSKLELNYFNYIK